MAKGSEFERDICKLLSKWWTKGESDDIFWRSSQSGGRATTRKKSGKTSSTDTGDIRATDPRGFPFLKAFAVEAKRGYKGACLSDLMDVPCEALVKGKKHYEEWIEQARSAHLMSKSLFWLLIHRRDKQETTVLMPATVFSETSLNPSIIQRDIDTIRFRWVNRQTDRTTVLLQLRLEDFLRIVSPDDVLNLLKRKT